jgi:acetyl-CoA carboxylase carboxyl transferase subunit alpha
MTIPSNPLDFEGPLIQLEAELEQLKDDIAGGDLSRRSEYKRLETKVARLREEIYGKLTAYQRVQLSRHFDRPFTLDYIKHIFTDFIELHGDRQFRDDPAIVGGTAKLGSQPVMIVGHQRGKTTADRLKRNFGMPNPEGYRKALRLFRLSEKFELPLITFIDTQGAYPGVEAEERGQAEAIATNILELAELTVPIISVVIGEGGSGGALALGVADRILMLEHACYSVITPESCATILWRDSTQEVQATRSAQMAEALQLTAGSLYKHGIIDEIIPEPVGGAHRNHKESAENLKVALVRHMETLRGLVVEELRELRYSKYRALGPVVG